MPGGGGELPWGEMDRDFRQKIRIKSEKKTNLWVAQAIFDPYRDHTKKENQRKVNSDFITKDWHRIMLSLAILIS